MAPFSGFFLVWVVFTVKATLTFLHHPPRVQARVLVSGSVPPRGPRSPSQPWGSGAGPGVHGLVFGGTQLPAGLNPFARCCPSEAGGKHEDLGQQLSEPRGGGGGGGLGRGDLTPSPSRPAGRAGLCLALRFAGSCLPWSPWLPISRLALLLAPEYAAGQRHVLVRGEQVGAEAPGALPASGLPPR